MQLFALQTDVSKTKQSFLAPGESEIFLVHRHFMSFIVQVIWQVILTFLLLAFFSYMAVIGIISPLFATIAFFFGWCSFVLFGLMRAFLDWRFDFMFLTTDKLVILDQTSLFRKTITPINLENLGDVVSETQWLNLFKFGIIRFGLKEGKGQEIRMKFIPNADTLVSMISQQITLYQRRKDYIVPYRSQDGTH
ncbi:MAG: hypothetical protein ABL890_05075 [Candidatus Peribacteraceae bacterium]